MRLKSGDVVAEKIWKKKNSFVGIGEDFVGWINTNRLEGHFSVRGWLWCVVGESGGGGQPYGPASGGQLTGPRLDLVVVVNNLGGTVNNRWTSADTGRDRE